MSSLQIPKPEQEPCCKELFPQKTIRLKFHV